jgi:HNH endonuclease
MPTGNRTTANLMGSGSDWRTWLATIIAREEVVLQQEQARLEGIRSGRRLKSHNMRLGWSDPLASQTAYVHAIQQWISCLREPDMWLLAFLDRGDFGSGSCRYGFEHRRTQFFRKHAAEPSWERSRPRYVNKRRKAAARHKWEQEHKIGVVNRRAIYERDGGICRICREPVSVDSFHLDHIDPGGPHGPENLRITHPLCNVHRGSPDGWMPGAFRYPESES